MLLGEKIYAALDWNKAESRAIMVEMGRPSTDAFFTGEHLVEDCKEPRPRYCSGYIIAVVDSRLASDPRGRQGVRRFCMPVSLMMGHAEPTMMIVYDVLDYLAKTPAAKAKVGFEAVAEALAAKFPC